MRCVPRAWRPRQSRHPPALLSDPQLLDPWVLGDRRPPGCGFVPVHRNAVHIRRASQGAGFGGPPPLYGQHTDEVLTGVLGHTQQDLAELRASGSTSDPAGGSVTMAVTLCMPPRAGELCAPVRFLVRQDSVVMELTARHRITSVEWDEREHAVAMVVEITDPRNRTAGGRANRRRRWGVGRADARTRMIGGIVRDGRHCDVVGTYLGVVADEN